MIKSVHELPAEVMSPSDVWVDALQLGALLRENMLKAEPMERLRVPLPVFLSALDTLNREELETLGKCVQERLTG